MRVRSLPPRNHVLSPSTRTFRTERVLSLPTRNNMLSRRARTFRAEKVPSPRTLMLSPRSNRATFTPHSQTSANRVHSNANTAALSPQPRKYPKHGTLCFARKSRRTRTRDSFKARAKLLPNAKPKARETPCSYFLWFFCLAGEFFWFWGCVHSRCESDGWCYFFVCLKLVCWLLELECLEVRDLLRGSFWLVPCLLPWGLFGFRRRRALWYQRLSTFTLVGSSRLRAGAAPGLSLSTVPSRFGASLLAGLLGPLGRLPLGVAVAGGCAASFCW
jgi:hypothetical protein